MEQRLCAGNLGKTHGRIALHYKEEHRLACQRMAEQAVRRLDILTYDLDPALYDQPPFLEAVKQLALNHRLSLIRILLQDSARVQHHGHRLTELARRLPSKIEIRRPHPDAIDHAENFLIADETGFVHRSLYSQYDGEADFNDRLASRELSRFFIQLWNRSEQETSLRRLSL